MSRPSPCVLVVGHLPPPSHGATAMGQLLKEALEALQVEFTFIDKAFSREIGEVGTASSRKIARAVGILAQIALLCVTRRPSLCVYFVAAAKMPLLFDFAAILLLRCLGITLAPYLHGTGYSRIAGGSWLWARLLGWVFRSSRKVVVIGHALKEDLSRWVSEERFEVVHNAIHDDATLSNHRSSGGKKTVLYLSNLQPSKGAFEFILAAERILEVRQDARFVLAGGARHSEYVERLRRRVESRGYSENIVFAGAVYGEEKLDLLARADVFVFPSLHEAFGLVNLEAMRAGVPVVASKRGAIPEIVLDGETGYLVEPADATEIADRVLGLLDDPDLRARMGAAGRARFEAEFEFSSFRERWAEVLSAAVGLSGCSADDRGSVGAEYDEVDR